MILLAGSVLLTWIYLRTGSVLLAGLMHASLNGTVPLTWGLDAAWVWQARAFVLVVIAVVVLAVEGRRWWSASGATASGKATRPGADSPSTAAFLVPVVIVAAHVVDDRFLQPELGTFAADHLVSGLVPLAGLLLAAAAYSRLRSGAKAILCAVVGLFGITAGMEGWSATLQVGPSRDDYTGLLALLAGAALMIMSAATLWRTRRRDQPLWRLVLRRGVITMITLVVLLQVAYPSVLAYLGTHQADATVSAADMGAPHETVGIRTSDGVLLQAWYVPSRNRAAIITYPGRREAQRYARFLARHGYGVLLLDRRGQGGSEGDPNSYGWDGQHDVAAAIAFLGNRPEIDPERIGAIGFSVGGEVLLETAATTPELRAVVSEGAGFRSIREFRHVAAARWFTLPLAFVVTLSTAIFSDRLPPPDLADLVARIAPRPVLLIQAEDGVGGEELNGIYRQAAGPTAELWTVPDSSHVGGIDAQPEEYQRRVTDFFDRALLAASQ